MMTICHYIPTVSNESEIWESWIKAAGKLLSSGIYLNKFTSHLLLSLVWESYSKMKQYAVFIGLGLLFSCLWAYFPGQPLPVLTAHFSHRLSFFQPLVAFKFNLAQWSCYVWQFGEQNRWCLSLLCRYKVGSFSTGRLSYWSLAGGTLQWTSRRSHPDENN